MKSTQILKTPKLLLAILVFSFLVTGLASAQNTLIGTFKLDEEAHWVKATLPAGTYTLTIDSAQLPVRAVIRSTDGKIVAMAITTITSDPVSDQSVMYVTGVGTQRKIRSLNLPQLGFSLDYAPMTKAEREYFSDVKTGAVPVTIASR
jgi:hypothetical protein